MKIDDCLPLLLEELSAAVKTSADSEVWRQVILDGWLL